MIQSIYNNGLYDTIPDWFTWELNGIEHAGVADIIKQDQQINDFKFIPLKSIPFASVGTLREEMFATAKKICKIANSRTITIAVSGIDSEIIARLLVEAGADVEIVYTRFWFKGNTELEIIKKLSKQLDVPYFVYDFSWNEHYKSVLNSLETTCIPATMMNYFHWMFSHRPLNNFFVTGHGTFRKSGGRFKHIAARYNLPDQIKKRGRAFPFELRDTCLRQMAQTFNLAGEFYFHINNITEVAAYFKHPNLEYNYDTFEIEDKMVYIKEFPECFFKNKTSPFFNGSKLREERILNLFDSTLEKKYSSWEYFKTRTTTDFIFIDEIFT
jgi:7-cyano-7-deazaguanine synthase in queuosine biosynthesis